MPPEVAAAPPAEMVVLATEYPEAPLLTGTTMPATLTPDVEAALDPAEAEAPDAADAPAEAVAEAAEPVIPGPPNDVQTLAEADGRALAQ